MTLLSGRRIAARKAANPCFAAFAIFLAFLVGASASAFGIRLNTTTVDFASAAEAREILTTPDEFIGRLTSFDRAARMKADRDVSQEEFLSFVGQSALEWKEAERKRLETILTLIKSRLREVPAALPARIVLVRTTGVEEGGAASTRGRAIILSAKTLTQTADLERTVCHELFHILSRHNPDLRERLYATIGFTKCEEVSLPAEIEARRISNPDAPQNNHLIKLKVDDKECVGVPLLLSETADYDKKRGGELFDRVQFRFLVAREPDDLTRSDAAPHARELVELERVSGFFEQVGKNTGYITHPEEILADNFALLVLAETSVRSPEILRKMKDILRSAPAS